MVIEFFQVFGQKNREKWRGSVIIVLLVMVLAALVLSLQNAESNAHTTAHVTELQQCNNQVVAQLIVALNARTAASDHDRNALNTFLIDLGKSKTPKQSETLYLNYLDEIKQSDDDRKLNPLPPPPNKVCK